MNLGAAKLSGAVKPHYAAASLRWRIMLGGGPRRVAEEITEELRQQLAKVEHNDFFLTLLPELEARHSRLVLTRNADT